MNASEKVERLIELLQHLRDETKPQIEQLQKRADMIDNLTIKEVKEKKMSISTIC